MLLLAGTLLAAPPADASSWDEVNPRDPALRAPTVTPGADAEVILGEIEVRDEGRWDATQSVVSFHFLIKLFNERGRDAMSRVDIPYERNERVAGIAARTIHSDGTVVQLGKDAVFDRTIRKAAGVKVKAKSFVFPAADTSSILEYRYRLVRYGSLTNYARLQLQWGVPVRRLVVRLKPLVFPPGAEITMRYRSFNAPFPAPVMAADGFATSVMTDIPAFETEPYMPPELQARGFVLLYYGDRQEPPVEEYWRKSGKDLYEWSSDRLKPGEEVRKAAEEAVGGARIPEEQLPRLYAYCRARIRNVDDDASPLTERERDELKENKNPRDTLRRGSGTSWDIDLLFASMAEALHLDARMAFLADKTETVFDPGQKLLGLLTESCVAVRLAWGWTFYSPGSVYPEPGRLPWWLEGQDAFIPGPDQSEFVKTPLCPADGSLERRSASLRVGADGSLEGDVRVQSWGHTAYSTKEEYDEASGTGRVEAVRDEVRKRFPDAEVSNVALAHVADDSLPCVVSYHIRVPAYARRAGSRILLEPDFFDRGSPPVFTAKARRHPIAFSYAATSEDSVVFGLPESVEVEGEPPLEPLVLRGIGGLDAQILLAADGRSLCYRRTLRLGENGSLLVPRSEYPGVKDFFDRVQAAAEQPALLRPLAASR